MIRIPASPLPLLVAASGAGRLADQLTLAAIPLVAVSAFGAGPHEIGVLVAIHGAAWLFASLPGGAVIDRLAPRSPAMLMLAASAAALVIAGGAGMAGSWALFAATCFVAAVGPVMLMLASAALVAISMAPAAFSTANSRIEFARAAAGVVAPILAAGMAATSTTILLVAALAMMIACTALARLPPDASARPAAGERDIVAGARFVVSHPILRAIALCSIFWNIAYFALIAILVPFAVERIGISPSEATASQSAFGVGAIAAAFVAPAVMTRVAPRFVLVLGPLASVIAGVLVATADGTASPLLPVLAFALLGFTPTLWLVCQTTLRQLVTPTALLGRVSGAIQVAIYGVRPLGALAAGSAAEYAGSGAAIAVMIAAFSASAIAAILSPLGRMRALPAHVATA